MYGNWSDPTALFIGAVFTVGTFVAGLHLLVGMVLKAVESHDDPGDVL